MKELCKHCPERDYCTEPCLESLAEIELEEESDRIKGKYIATPRPLVSYAESRILAKSHPWDK